MRVALILPGFSATTADWAIPALQNLVQQLGQQVDLHIFSQRYPTPGAYNFEGIPHHALGGGQNFGIQSLRIWLRSSQAIIAQHQQTPFDLLHAFWADEAGFSAAIAAQKIKRPLVVSLGGGELTHLPDIAYGAQRFLVRRLTTRFALRQATRVTAGSNYQLDLCRQHRVPLAKLRLVPLGVDTHRFQPPSAKPDLHQHPALIQVASLLPVKNQALLLQTLHHLKQKLPHITLHLVGSGPLEKGLVALSHELKVHENIRWYSQVGYPELPALFQQAHLYVQTSRHESQGMAVLEGLACGVPMIGTPVGVGPEVAGWPPQTGAEALAQQAAQILQDEAGYLAQAQAAREVAESQYTLAKTTANFINIYQEIVDPHPQPLYSVESLSR